MTVERLPRLKDELKFLETLLPELESRVELWSLTTAVKGRIERIRKEIRSIESLHE